MIQMKPELFAALRAPEAQANPVLLQRALQTALQNAVELEHATIPTYLYAAYSVRPGYNSEIQNLIISVVIEEMLHMSLACNLLNAIGGAPCIDSPDFVPTYPGPLPGTVESGLSVPLARLSLNLIHDVFMKIEEPETPIHYRSLAAAPPPLTIGKFYDEIKHHIVKAGNSIFTGNPERQLKNIFRAGELITVTDVDTAVQAIDVIIEQGEGSRKSPLGGEDQYELAHYYRYAEIYHGRQLIPNPDAPPDAPEDVKYRYDGPPIPFDPTGVWPIIENPKAANYPANSTARYLCDTFNYTYTGLLKALHLTFNGQTHRVIASIGLMESLKEQAMRLVEVDLGDGTTAGPSFEYQPINP